MKNHWLDKIEEKDFLQALDEVCTDVVKQTDLDKQALNQLLNEDCEKAEFIDSDFLFEEDYQQQLQSEKDEIKAVLDKYKDHQWFAGYMDELGFTQIATLSTTELNFNTTITIPGDQNLGEIDDVTYFRDKLFTPLKFPFNITFGFGDAGKDVKENKKSEFGEICSACGTEMWPMNTATSMTQGDPMCACYNGDSCNLGIFYPDQQFIQNEELQIISDKIEMHDVTQYQTMYTPVLPGTMTGTVYMGDKWGWIFCVMSDGKFDFRRFEIDADGKTIYPDGIWGDTPKTVDDDVYSLQKLAEGGSLEMPWYDEVYAFETNLNCATGVLELHYKGGKRPQKIVASYEYNREGS